MTFPQGDFTNARSLGLYDSFKNLSKHVFNFTYAPGETVSTIFNTSYKTETDHDLSFILRQPNLFVTAAYEDTALFGKVLQAALNDTDVSDLNNGAAFAKRYWNRTFFLETGPIEFDEVGERKQPLSIQQFQKDRVWPVTVMTLDVAGQNFVDVAPVNWSVPFPPPNEPICGYLGTSVLCQKRGKLDY